MSATLGASASHTCGLCVPPTARVSVAAPVTPDVVASLCASVTGLIGGGAPCVILCDAGCPVPPDLSVVEALARLQVAARRLGGEIRVCAERRELRELLSLAGLGDVILTCPWGAA